LKVSENNNNNIFFFLLQEEKKMMMKENINDVYFKVKINSLYNISFLFINYMTSYKF